MMIGVEALLDLILAQVAPLQSVSIDIRAASGCVLAADLLAVDPLPPFANSAMDGYAIRRADLTAVDRFRVVDDLPAGHTTDRSIAAGEAALIATGAAIPAGSDAVVPIEQARRSGVHVSLRPPIPEHGHIRPRGEDVSPWSILARAGDILTQSMTVLALAAGVTTVRVIPKPTIGILTTGDELIATHLPLGPSTVRDVDTLLLSDAIHALGMTPLPLGPIPDNPAVVAGYLTTRSFAHAIVMCGGLGRGPRDIVVDAIRRSGTVHAFDVAMRPGRSFAFGRVGNRPVYAVPGNPGAAIVALHALVVPALRTLAGKPPHQAEIVAMLTASISNHGGRRHYVRVRLSWDGPTLQAIPTGRGGSGMVSDLVAADALLCIPADAETAEAGAAFPIIPLKPIGGF